MKKCLVISDSFKGTLSTFDACRAIAEGFKLAAPAWEVLEVPIADGGEGAVAVVHHHLGGSFRRVDITGPLGRPVQADYLLIGDRAYVEFASACGFAMSRRSPEDALHASSFGVGELLHAAASDGADELFLFLGGSASTDGGVGMAQALGVRFLDKDGEELAPLTGEPTAPYVEEIDQVDLSQSVPRTGAACVTGVVDVENPLLGKLGAASIYGPQKGMDREGIERREHSLKRLVECVERSGDPKALAEQAGAGSAGGAGYGVLGLLEGKLLRGTDFFLDLVGFKSELLEADLVVTGEGCLDQTSLTGKLLKGLMTEIDIKPVPVVSLVGDCRLRTDELAQVSGLSVFSLYPNYSHTEPAEALKALASQVGKLISSQLAR